MAKVICEECGTSFLYDVVKDMKACPVCGKPLWEGGDEETKNVDNLSQNELLSFGEGIELGENDSFDEDKVDFYFNDIIEPNELGQGEDGLTGGTCVKCGQHTSFLYPIAKKENCILLDSRETGKCSSCGNVLKNHVLYKLPADWINPRKRNMWTIDYENVPKCPVCSSTKIHKISMANKAASAIAFGMLAAGHVSKTFKCDTCGAKF